MKTVHSATGRYLHSTIILSPTPHAPVQESELLTQYFVSPSETLVVQSEFQPKASSGIAVGSVVVLRNVGTNGFLGLDGEIVCTTRGDGEHNHRHPTRSQRFVLHEAVVREGGAQGDGSQGLPFSLVAQTGTVY